MPYVGPNFEDRISALQEGLKLFLEGLEDVLEQQERVLITQSVGVHVDAQERREQHNERREVAREIHRLTILVAHTRRYMKNLVTPSRN